MYVLKLALRPWKVAPVSQLAHAVSVGALLLVFTGMLWMVEGLNPVIQRLEQEQLVTAYFLPTVTHDQETQVADTIRTRVRALAGTAIHVELTAAQQFLALLKQDAPELARELTDLTAEGGAEDLLPRFITLKGSISKSLVDEVQKIPGIDSVETSASRTRPVAQAFKTLQWIVRALGLGLLVALLSAVYHLSRSHLAIHGQTVSILRLWGGHSLKAKMPCLVSGISVGGLGGLIATGLWVVCCHSLRGQFLHLSPALESLPLIRPEFGIVPLGLGLCLGVLSGLFSQSSLQRNAGIGGQLR